VILIDTLFVVVLIDEDITWVIGVIIKTPQNSVPDNYYNYSLFSSQWHQFRSHCYFLALDWRSLAYPTCRSVSWTIRENLKNCTTEKISLLSILNIKNLFLRKSRKRNTFTHEEKKSIHLKRSIRKLGSQSEVLKAKKFKSSCRSVQMPKLNYFGTKVPNLTWTYCTSCSFPPHIPYNWTQLDSTSTKRGYTVVCLPSTVTSRRYGTMKPESNCCYWFKNGPDNAMVKFT